jgi:hypothetical protein
MWRSISARVLAFNMLGRLMYAVATSRNVIAIASSSRFTSRGSMPSRIC